jgi:hypothetical protein
VSLARYDKVRGGSFSNARFVGAKIVKVSENIGIVSKLLEKRKYRMFKSFQIDR